MTVPGSGLPDPPLCAHTTASPPHKVQPIRASQSIQVESTAQHFLREEDERIATELPALSPIYSRQKTTLDESQWALQHELTQASTEQGRRDEEEYRRRGFIYNHYRVVRRTARWYHPFTAWWRRDISAHVDPGKRRDHLALERTFLGYLRTSVALSQVGVVTAQLFRLQHSITPDMTFGFFVSGEPIAVCFMGAAVVIVLVGWIRFWRQQRAMIKGKIWAGGWEIFVVMGLATLLCVALFAVTLGVAIRHD